MSKIYFDEEQDRRIEYARHKMNDYQEKKGLDFIYTESDFRHYLFTLGLMKYEFEILPKLSREPYKAYYYIQGEEVHNRIGGVTA